MLLLALCLVFILPPLASSLTKNTHCRRINVQQILPAITGMFTISLGIFRFQDKLWQVKLLHLFIDYGIGQAIIFLPGGIFLLFLFLA